MARMTITLLKWWNCLAYSLKNSQRDALNLENISHPTANWKECRIFSNGRSKISWSRSMHEYNLGTVTSDNKLKGSNNSWNPCWTVCLKSEQVPSKWFTILGWPRKQPNKKCNTSTLNLGSWSSTRKWRPETTTSMSLGNKFGTTNHNVKMAQSKITMDSHLMIPMSSGMARMWNIKGYRISESSTTLSPMWGTRDTARASICSGLMPLATGSLIDALCYFTCIL